MGECKIYCIDKTKNKSFLSYPITVQQGKNMKQQKNTNNKKSIHYQSDVIIIGGGLAGLVSARELLDSEKKVLIIERDTEENLGGLAKKSFGGVTIVDSPYQRRQGIADSPQLAFADWQSYAEFGEDDTLPKQWAKVYCERSHELIYTYLNGIGVKFLPVVNWPERGMFKRGNSLPRWHITFGTGYAIIEQVLRDLFSHKNIGHLTILYEHKVNAFTKKQNIVSGCKGITSSGQEFTATADFTIAASGGICGGDLSMVRKHWPKQWTFPQRMVNGGHAFADGLLHTAAQKIGARLTHLDKHWHYAAGIAHPRPEVSQHGLSMVPPRGALWVNALGERIGEKNGTPLVGYTDTRFLVEQVLQQPGQFSWQIMNYKIAAKELAVSGSEYMDAFRYKKKFKMIKELLFGNKELVNRLLEESEDVISADNLQELVEKMNALEKGKYKMDYETLKRSLQNYDEAVARSKHFITDEQLRRNLASRTYRGDRIRMTNLQKINDPKAGPLIAIREFILSRKSLGGIQTNLSSQVLDKRGKAINGFYAVGEVAGFGGGGIHGSRSLEGTFLGSCILTARIAAKAISEK